MRKKSSLGPRPLCWPSNSPAPRDAERELGLVPRFSHRPNGLELSAEDRDGGSGKGEGCAWPRSHGRDVDRTIRVSSSTCWIWMPGILRFSERLHAHRSGKFF